MWLGGWVVRREGKGVEWEVMFISWQQLEDCFFISLC